MPAVAAATVPAAVGADPQAGPEDHRKHQYRSDDDHDQCREFVDPVRPAPFL
jgi:hypothetical protein